MEGFQIYTANGNITPSTFVKIDTTLSTPNLGNRVITAGSGDRPIGVAQKGTRETPLSGLDTGFAAIAGQSLQVFTEGMVAPLALGGTVTAGDLLMPNTNGDGTAITATNGNWYGAVAPMSGIAGQLMECQVLIGYR